MVDLMKNQTSIFLHNTQCFICFDSNHSLILLYLPLSGYSIPSKYRTLSNYNTTLFWDVLKTILDLHATGFAIVTLITNGCRCLLWSYIKPQNTSKETITNAIDHCEPTLIRYMPANWLKKKYLHLKFCYVLHNN